MKTKIIDRTVSLKEEIVIYLKGDIKPVEKISEKLRIIENEDTTYVVIPVDDKHRYEGYMIPIIENYDSLEEVN